LGVAVLVAALHAPATALALTAHLIANGTGPLKDHAPGEDLRIGTGDDVIVSHPDSVGTNGSGPNTHGAASFAILNGSPGAPFPTWTNEALYGFDYILFVDGTLDFTADYAASTLSDLVVRITGCALRSTAEFNYAGGGPGSRGEATTTGCTGTGHFDPTTGTASVVITGTFAAPFDSLPLVDQTLTAAPGSATIVLKSSLGSSGNAYVDTVLAPLVPPNTTAVILVDFSGRTQEATHQDWATRGVLAAYTTDDLGCATGVLPCTGGSTTTTTLPLCSQYTTCEPALVARPAGSGRCDRSGAQGRAQCCASSSRRPRRPSRAPRSRRRRASRSSTRRRAAPLTRLGDVAAKADGRARLGVPLAAIQAALMRLLAVVPA
jgi:hypothetical protein